jgi:hypothetical protein
MRRVLMAGLAFAAIALTASGASAQTTIRYFTEVFGLLEDLDTDVILKETRSGTKVVAAELDVCHTPSPNSPLRERFVVSLKPQGKSLVGSGQSQIGKVPVSVDLVRSVQSGAVTFEGTIKYGGRSFKASSSDNNDISAKDFEEQTALEESIVEAPADFTEVTPGSIGFRVTRDSLLEALKSLRGDNVRVQTYTIMQSCEALRRGIVEVQLDVDPERAQALIAKIKALPGVSLAGWTGGGVDLARAVRIPATAWRDANGTLARTKIGNAIAGAVNKAFAGQAAAFEWDDVTGELKIVVKRPDIAVPGLGLTEVIDVPVVVSADRPGGKDSLVIRLGQISSITEDDGDTPRLTLLSNQDGIEPAGSDGVVAVLSAELGAERWDLDAERWVK